MINHIHKLYLLPILTIALIFGCNKGWCSTVSGGFEGSNVVNIQESSSNNFTCQLATPPMAVPVSYRYSDPGDHYHYWFMLKIENAAYQSVTVTITNADWGGSTFWGKDAVYTEAVDPYTLAAETTWQPITSSSYSDPDFSFVLEPTTDLAWVALSYPALPRHTENWVFNQAASSYVTAENILTTPQGRPLYMLLVTNPAIPTTNKRGILIYGQEHMAEQNGGWTCQGAVEFLTSGDAVAQTLLDNAVFIIIPDINPDATAAGTNCDPITGKSPEWRYNPAFMERMMPGTKAPMTVHSKAIWDRLSNFVNNGGSIDFCFNIHQGGSGHWWGAYDTTDPHTYKFNEFMYAHMPSSGAVWVPNAQQGYTQGSWITYTPDGVFAPRILGRCWEEWRTIPMGYELNLGSSSTQFLTNVSGLKYFGEALAKSANDFFGNFDRTVTVTAPNGSESYASGASASVSWSSTGTISLVNIDCSLDNGASWSRILTESTNDGSESVTLPSADSNSCLLRIFDASAFGVEDQSDSTFAIGTLPTGTFTVVSPTAGVVWDSHWYDSVIWNSTGSISNVHIELSTDNQSTWQQLAYSVATSGGSYLVNVPNTPSAQCYVRVTGIENNTVFDISDGPFTIQTAPAEPTLSIISPNGSESWSPGSSELVTWNSTGSIPDVGISISLDQGANWSTLIASTTNDGSESITSPGTLSDKCLLWIYDARNDPSVSRPDADPMDVSDNLFYNGVMPIFTPTQTVTSIPGTPIPNLTATTTPSNTVTPYFTSTPIVTITPSATITPTPTRTSTIATNSLVKDKKIVAFPNPAKDDITFIWAKSNIIYIQISVFNVRGEQIATLSRDNPGNRLTWSIPDIAPGIYFYKTILTDKENQKHNMPLSKIAITR